MKEGTLGIDLTVPSAWPPATELRIFAGKFNGADFSFSAGSSGSLTFNVQTGEEVIHYETPRLLLPDFPFLKVAFAWGRPNGIGCAINGVVVSGSGDAEISIEAECFTPTNFRLRCEYAVPRSCSDVEDAFLRFVLDLQGRIEIADRFNLREASAILRRLILDSSPVVHLANRRYRIDLRFPIVTARQGKYDSLCVGSQFTDLSPEYSNERSVKYLKLDELLGAEVLRNQGQVFAVSDIISVCANIKGGIHFDVPRKPVHQSIINLDDRLKLFAVDASLAALPGIAWSVINGVRPLVQAILLENLKVPGTD